MKESLKVSARQASLLGGLTVLFLLLFGLSGIICCVAADARGLTREMQRFAPPPVMTVSRGSSVAPRTVIARFTTILPAASVVTS